MNTETIKAAGWEAISGAVAGKRREVYAHLCLLGPCTTAELAAASGISILTVRPRVTELVQLGLARLADVQATKTEGKYEAIRLEDARAAYYRERAGGQMDLRIGA